jgi:hypothetical protein
MNATHEQIHYLQRRSRSIDQKAHASRTASDLLRPKLDVLDTRMHPLTRPPHSLCVRRSAFHAALDLLDELPNTTRDRIHRTT